MAERHLIKTGQITGVSVSGSTITLQCAINRIEDIRTAQLYNAPGEKSPPFSGNIALVLEVTDDFRIAVGVDDKVASAAEPGEKEIYSYDSGGAKLASILLNKGSEAIINEGTDFAVKFNALQTEFNELQTRFNDLVTVFNNHIHAGVGTPPTTSGNQSTADIDNTKVEKVRLP